MLDLKPFLLVDIFICHFGYFSLCSYAVAVETALRANGVQQRIYLLVCYVAASLLYLLSFGHNEILATPEFDTKTCEHIDVAKEDNFWMEYCNFEQFENIFVWKGIANKYGFDQKASGMAVQRFINFAKTIDPSSF